MTFSIKHNAVAGYLAKWTVITALVGTCVGSASAGFLLSLDWVTNYREGHHWIVVLLPIAGFLVGYMYYIYGKDVESGTNVLLETINGTRREIPFRLAPMIYLGTMATHLFGGSAGREGTALQMAGAIANQLTKPFRLNHDEQKILIVSAIAAGFGSVFGTPLAGAIFSVELPLIRRVGYVAALPAIAASLIADGTAKLWSAEHTHYAVGSIPAITLVNLLCTALAGAVFGVCAWMFTQLIHRVSYAFSSTIPFVPLRSAIGGSIVALSVWAIGSTKFIGLGIPTIVDSFLIQLPPYDFLLKVIFTVVTLSAGFKGGEVTPLFFIGATLGNSLVNLLPLPVGILAGMGFVAVFAGATKTPIACTVMAIELFGVESGVYAAIACVVAFLASGQANIYRHQPKTPESME